jgi:competence protein ComGC
MGSLRVRVLVFFRVLLSLYLSVLLLLCLPSLDKSIGVVSEEIRKMGTEVSTSPTSLIDQTVVRIFY